jgi:hypothetical protein
MAATPPFPTKAARKTQHIYYRGAKFTLAVEDSRDHPGHIEVELLVDNPPRGLDNLLHRLVMRPPETGDGGRDDLLA